MHAYELRFRVPKACMSGLVGKGGSNINKIKQRCGVRADFINVEDPEEGGVVEVQLEGTREGCSDAKVAILEFIDETVSGV
jgi:transcription antitermination factor NusA-like protein